MYDIKPPKGSWSCKDSKWSADENSKENVDDYGNDAVHVH